MKPRLNYSSRFWIPISFFLGTLNKVLYSQVVRNVTGKCSETMAYHSWDAHEFLGEQVRIRLVYNGSESCDHIKFADLGGDICCHQ